ncbi:receptor-transporting protein 3-like [Penaeus monodon]|uniref:receptor-transporting protein 3-like n=1 Tax=Penaeus monodon TaxID=6687 RepID=UPI0018A747BB|nr:receptor-transporting protein 3-like [Penaeus monodon]
MSLRRRSLPPGDRSHPVVSFACVGQPHPLLPPACHATIASHAPWSSVSTLGELQSPVQHAYGAHVDVSITATPQIQKKMVASGSASPQCPLVPLPQLSRSSFHVGYYVPPSVEPGDPYGGLEQVWNQHFELLFRTLPNVWYFGPIQKTPTGWSVFKDMAKVRFSCQRCSHGWTSMYGLVVFYYRWDAFMNQGHVRFILTGQKCNQCERSAFETPMWYPEEAQKVMTNLYHEVANRVYGLQTPPLIRDRRHGRPRQQHNSSMCEGCHQGICKAPRNTVPSASS